MRLPHLSILSVFTGCSGVPLKLAEDSASTMGAADTAEAPATDLDGDGVPAPADCDDTVPEVFPGAEERCNGRDDNCDGQVDEGVLLPFFTDADGDGHGSADDPVQACSLVAGLSADSHDCDDTNPDVSPSAAERCNGRDDDCDEEIDEGVLEARFVDADADGWGDDASVVWVCPDTSGTAADGGDCDDTDPSVHPGVVGDACDGVDSDCDGNTDEDHKAGWMLVSVDTADGRVYEIDPATAALTEITPVSTARGINTMDVSANGVSLVQTHTSPGAIEQFDACNGTLVPIGPHGAGGIGGIGFGPSGRLFGIGSSDQLFEFDLGTGVATAIGPLGIDIGTSGLAWDCTHQRMYGAEGSGDRIFEVDLTTGQAVSIQSTAVPFESVGLEFDHTTGLLFAATRTALYTIDPTTGASTFIGTLAAGNIDDLAWHPVCP